MMMIGFWVCFELNSKYVSGVFIVVYYTECTLEKCTRKYMFTNLMKSVFPLSFLHTQQKSRVSTRGNSGERNVYNGAPSIKSIKRAISQCTCIYLRENFKSIMQQRRRRQRSARVRPEPYGTQNRERENEARTNLRKR